jgi:DNA helicase-2/ATP-dependent DNA helicase PcrA
MAAFEREFRVQNLIKLEQNYRSHGYILDAANTLISNNAKRLGKNLRTDAGHGEPIRIYEASSDLQEANWIIEEAKGLIADGASRSEIAVLYRSNAQSRVIEHALFSAGIPYRVYGGQRFFERAEIKHAIAYLQLIDNPHNDSAFLRVVNFPTRGIGARSLEQLQDMAKQRSCSLHDAVAHVPGRPGTLLSNFVKLIDDLRAETGMLSLPEMVQVMLERSGLITHYHSEREGADRVENLQQLVSAATQFISEEGFGRSAPALQGPSAEAVAGQAIINADGVEIVDADAPSVLVMSPLSAFLSHASLEAGESQAHAGQEALQLMTVHAAKGLEFDAVFITGLEEGLFPHENSDKAEGGVEEERRLMYVAITRARRRLYLSFSQTRMLHGQTRFNIKSRFFNELPEEALKWLSPKVVQHHWFASQTKAAWVDTPARQPALSASTDSGWRIGQTVFHQRFGEGVIVNIEGGGGNARASINFGREGMKLLDLTIAKLEKMA